MIRLDRKTPRIIKKNDSLKINDMYNDIQKTKKEVVNLNNTVLTIMEGKL